MRSRLSLLSLVICSLLTVSCFVLVACGGGGGSSTTPSQPTITAVNVSCTPASIQTGQTSKCSATVSGTGSYNSAVSWTVDNGAIDQSGNYTPPVTATTATVKATSAQDSAKSGTAQITVTNSTTSAVVNPTGPIMVPPVLVSGQLAQVTVTSFVKGADASTQVQFFNLSGGTPALIGTMRDDGQGGDQVAGDHIYTITTALTGPAASSLPLQIVASASTAGGANVDFSVQVVQIPSYATNTDLNQAETQLYNTAIQTKGLFSNPSWTNQKLLRGISGNLISIFGGLEAVTNQNVGLQAARAESGHRNAKVHRADTVSDTAGDILTSGLLNPAQNAVSCDQLVESLGGFSSSYPNALSPDDPRLIQFAQELTTICSGAPSCQGAFAQSDFLGSNLAAAEWAHEYIVSGQALPTPISGCGGGVAGSLAGVAVKSELQQFTDLAGDGITSLANLGQMSAQAVGQAADYLVGWFVDVSGNQGAGSQGITIAQVAPNETFAAPTGTYTLACSFGGDTANGTITNTPVYPQSTTFINPSPSVTTTVTPPFVTSFAPITGPVGAPVSILGTGFDTDATGNQVTFNGTASLVGSSTASSIQTSVPAEAISGPVTVTTGSGTTTSSLIFVVGNSSSNPIPAITNLTPSSLSVGATPQVLGISGSGFLTASTVTFNGVSHTPTFVSASQLAISLTSGDLATAGTFPVVVTNPAPGGGVSNSESFIVANVSGVTISPSSVTLAGLGTQQFTATWTGQGSAYWEWTVEEGTSGGTISNTGLYTAPSTSGTYHVVAVDGLDSSQSATATVTVVQVTINTFTVPTASSSPIGIVAGPDGNLWFTEYSGNKIGRITTAGVITEFAVPTASAAPQGIAAGPDGNLWFTESGGQKVGRITPSGVIAEYPFLTAHNSSSQGGSIVAGPDGNLWFTESGNNKIGRITTAGVITEFAVPTASADPQGIAAGPDGNLWFTENQGNIGRITTAGDITEFTNTTISQYDSGSTGIVAGPDGNLWFTGAVGAESDYIGRITTAGVITSFAIPAVYENPTSITTGPDGNLWFTEPGALDEGGWSIGRITTAGVITEFIIPPAGLSVPWGIAAGPDGNLWFTDERDNKIEQIVLATVPSP
jgi:streptogramin lyase